ncbi:hypothetical protein OH76DRAFT_923877 [Lentinus brumalis]|uniref:Uncharacterized protein n=1 Tax=Lentinus brumalis TaxID=2498619 RepID=A0A371CZU7_9APHY|nr:hypothetical protein OH76DRAFT_923877 [Polyporus brumalis]
MIPPQAASAIFKSLARVADTSDALKIALHEISYKPFISFFNVTGTPDHRRPQSCGHWCASPPFWSDATTSQSTTPLCWRSRCMQAMKSPSRL